MRKEHFYKPVEFDLLLDNGNTLCICGSVGLINEYEPMVMYYRDGSGYPGSCETTIWNLDDVWAHEYDNNGWLVREHDPEDYAHLILYHAAYKA